MWKGRIADAKTERCKLGLLSQSGTIIFMTLLLPLIIFITWDPKKKYQASNQEVWVLDPTWLDPICLLWWHWPSYKKEKVPLFCQTLPGTAKYKIKQMKQNIIFIQENGENTLIPSYVVECMYICMHRYKHTKMKTSGSTSFRWTEVHKLLFF